MCVLPEAWTFLREHTYCRHGVSGHIQDCKIPVRVLPDMGAVVLGSYVWVVDPSAGVPSVPRSPVRSGLRLTPLPALAFASFSSSI